MHTIDNFSQGNDKFSLDQVLEALGIINKEKGIDKLLNLVKEKIFGNQLTKENLPEFKHFVREFTSLYYLMKTKFSEIERSSGERYFEHLREVVKNVLDLPNPNIKKVLIAIAHDSIEDTNKTYEGLCEDYGYEVAIAVQAVSKEGIDKYIDYSIEDNKKREKKAKEIRNDVYFGHLMSFETMYNHVVEITKSKGLNLSEEKLSEITINALDVKFADRIHNLTTQWEPSDLKWVRSKVEETKKYFLGIALEINQEAYNKLQSLILILEIKLNGANEKIEKLIEVD